jgi:hypothetical protein
MLLVDTWHKFVGTFHSQYNNKSSQNVFQLTSQPSFIGKDFFPPFPQKPNLVRRHIRLYQRSQKGIAVTSRIWKQWSRHFERFVLEYERDTFVQGLTGRASSNVLETPAGVRFKTCGPYTAFYYTIDITLHWFVDLRHKFPIWGSHVHKEWPRNVTTKRFGSTIINFSFYFIPEIPYYCLTPRFLKSQCTSNSSYR